LHVVDSVWSEVGAAACNEEAEHWSASSHSPSIWQQSAHFAEWQTTAR